MADIREVPTEVVACLGEWAGKGWQFIFITGRPFQWCVRALEVLPFPYAVAIQNGALLLKMPSKTILSRKYLVSAILPSMERLCFDRATDFIIYCGLEYGDRCYYRPEHLPPSLLSYLQARSAALGELWEAVQTFLNLPVVGFCSLKLFAKEAEAQRLSTEIETLGLHAPLSRDPFNREYFVIQATHSEATKGNALKMFARLLGVKGPIIAAGDDHNDRSMLQVADVKIVMEDAPSELLELADIVAPAAAQKGIIWGLREASRLLDG